MKFEKIENNETSSICAKCGGCCCKRFACQLIPSDIFGDEKPTIERFLAFMADDHYAVDWWDGDVRPDEYFEEHPEKYPLDRVFYVRPAHKGISHKFDASWGGECIFFVGGKGCSLSFEERPYGGKLLVAREDFHCENAHGITKRDMIAAWLPYQDWFLEVIS